MIIGLFGPHALGKTTYLRDAMDSLADNAQSRLRIVLADLRQEYHLADDKTVWLKIIQPHWQGNSQERTILLQKCMADDAVWIVESAWCFRGMQHTFGDAIKFIIPVAEPSVMKRFLQTRCELQGKTFRDDYWYDTRLIYESSLRYLNVVKNVPHTVVTIDAQRKAWAEIHRLLLEELCS